VLEKPESWCSQQVAACKTEVVSSRGVGAPKNDNVKKKKISLIISRRRGFSLYGFPQEIYVFVYFMCVIDGEYSIVYLTALL
jgi:hypothetical protein